MDIYRPSHWYSADLHRRPVAMAVRVAPPQLLEINLGPQRSSVAGESAKGAEVIPDFVVETDEEKRHVIIPFTPHDANCTARSGLEETFRAGSAQQFDAESVRCATRDIKRADVLIRFKNELLLVGGETIEALDVALLVQEPHLLLLHALS